LARSHRHRRVLPDSAGLHGIVGFKPTQRRVPLDGGVPLSFSLDSFGPLARQRRLLRGAGCRAGR